ncbi:MAG: histidine kinase [Bacteroidota bacterium]
MKSINISSKWIRIGLHIIAWAIVLSLPYLLRNEERQSHPDDVGFFILNTVTGFLWVGVFYLNASVLVPRYINTKNYLLFTLSVIAVFCVAMMIHLWLFSLLIHSRPVSIPPSIKFNLPTFILTIAVSTTYKILVDKARQDKLLQDKQEQNLKTEVSFLRSQISPHFIFNVLNNMVALVRTKSDELEPTIMKLSSLMQYMLYETDEEKVSLDSEITYIKNYIELQRQRFGAKVVITADFVNPNGHYEIEPMLLIPFVENAFKHGVGFIQRPEINIRLTLKDNVLHFFVRNKYNPDGDEIKDKTSGIGLANVTRRLNLLYPDKHTLLINKTDIYFETELTLSLH